MGRRPDDPKKNIYKLTSKFIIEFTYFMYITVNKATFIIADTIKAYIKKIT